MKTNNCLHFGIHWVKIFTIVEHFEMIVDLNIRTKEGAWPEPFHDIANPENISIRHGYVSLLQNVQRIYNASSRIKTN